MTSDAVAGLVALGVGVLILWAVRRGNADLARHRYGRT